MSKKKSILDMLEEEVVEEVTEEVAEDTAVVMSPINTKRQTYCMTKFNIELLRHLSFDLQMNKQDIVNIAVYRYIRDNFPEVYNRVRGIE